MSTTPLLPHSLGASDIRNIVDAILPPLEPFLYKSTKEQAYVILYREVLKLSKDKTFTNAADIDVLVKDIVTQIADRSIKTLEFKIAQDADPSFSVGGVCCCSNSVGRCVCTASQYGIYNCEEACQNSEC